MAEEDEEEGEEDEEGGEEDKEEGKEEGQRCMGTTTTTASSPVARLRHAQMH